MLPEMLVIFACVNNTGCSETSSLYFSQNPQVKKQIDFDTEQVREYIGPKVVDVVGPLLFFSAGGTGTIKLNKYFSLQLKKDTGIISFHEDLPW